MCKNQDPYSSLGLVAKWAESVDSDGSSLAIASGLKIAEYFVNDE